MSTASLQPPIEAWGPRRRKSPASFSGQDHGPTAGAGGVRARGDRGGGRDALDHGAVGEAHTGSTPLVLRRRSLRSSAPTSLCRSALASARSRQASSPRRTGRSPGRPRSPRPRSSRSPLRCLRPVSRARRSRPTRRWCGGRARGAAAGETRQRWHELLIELTIADAVCDRRPERPHPRPQGATERPANKSAREHLINPIDRRITTPRPLHRSDPLRNDRSSRPEYA